MHETYRKDLALMYHFLKASVLGARNEYDSKNNTRIIRWCLIKKARFWCNTYVSVSSRRLQVL